MTLEVCVHVGSGEGDSPTPQPIKIDSKSAALCLDLLLFITLRNRDRIASTWPLVESHLHNIILPSDKHGPVPQELLENAVLNLLKVCQRLLPYKPDVSDLLLRSLELVLNVEPTIVKHMAQRVALEVLQLVKGAAEFIHQVGKTVIIKWHTDWLDSDKQVRYIRDITFGRPDWEIGALGCKGNMNGLVIIIILIIIGSVVMALFSHGNPHPCVHTLKEAQKIICHVQNPAMSCGRCSWQGSGLQKTCTNLFHIEVRRMFSALIYQHWINKSHTMISSCFPGVGVFATVIKNT